TGGLYFFRTNNAFNTTVSLPTYDMELTDNGNVIQPVTSNGLVKAMALIDRDGNVVRCYNSQLAAATSTPCGITVNHTGDGDYVVTFQNLQIDNRFISVTASRDTDVMVVNLGVIFGNTVNIHTALNHDTSGNVFEQSPAQFTIFIF